MWDARSRLSPLDVMKWCSSRVLGTGLWNGSHHVLPWSFLYQKIGERSCLKNSVFILFYLVTNFQTPRLPTSNWVSRFLVLAMLHPLKALVKVTTEGFKLWSCIWSSLGSKQKQRQKRKDQRWSYKCKWMIWANDLKEWFDLISFDRLIWVSALGKWYSKNNITYDPTWWMESFHQTEICSKDYCTWPAWKTSPSKSTASSWQMRINESIQNRQLWDVFLFTNWNILGSVDDIY